PLARPRPRHHHQSRSQRVQAPADGARTEGHHQGVRHRTPLPHRAKIYRMKPILLLLLMSAAALLVSQPWPREQVGPLPSGGFLLNSGWRIRPAGNQVTVGTMPMSSVLSPDGKFLLVLNGGYNPPAISVLDVASEKEVSRTPVADGWLGLAFTPKGDT